MIKAQHLAIIFIIIILPISLVLSNYIQSQIDTITLQTQYNSRLYESTYDAVQAFQINTVNNRYSSISDSKIRDIEASVNTFYNSLSNNINASEIGTEALRPFVPALVYTLYDGYYIYSKYNNVYPENNGDVKDDSEVEDEYGLKPYIYYSGRYRKGNNDFVVNYTLDNAITIYGRFGTEYRTLSGYLINPEQVENIDYASRTLTYNGIEIKPEILTEYLLFTPRDEDAESGNYQYIVYDGKKVYYDPESTNEDEKYFWYDNYSKTYISIYNTEVLEYARARTSGDRFYSTSAFDYFYEAERFSREVIDLIGTVTQDDAVDAEGNKIEFAYNTGNEPIFNTTVNNNDPLISGSTFNENRMGVIRNSIETNLVAAIANYNSYSGFTYEFALPVFTESDWGKIVNNISVISFLQGIPIGYKYYNNYCIVTNDKNEEVVKKDSIYIITANEDGTNREYHLPGCTKLVDSEQDRIVEAYSNLSFVRQTVRISEGNYLYFYPQMRKDLSYITGCYECIVNASDTYNLDDIINGRIYHNEEVTGQSGLIYNEDQLEQVRTAYITALARERYDLYQTNIDSMSN